MKKNIILLPLLMLALASCGGNNNSTAGSVTVTPTEKLELTRSTLFAGLSGTSYATYDGDHTVGNYTINTSNVLGNSVNTLDVIQFKASAGTLTVNGAFQKVTIELESTFDYDADHGFSVYVGDSKQTIDAAAVNSARVDSGLKGGKDNGYTVYYYTIEVSLDSVQSNTFKIAKETQGAGYATKITLE